MKREPLAEIQRRTGSGRGVGSHDLAECVGEQWSMVAADGKRGGC